MKHEINPYGFIDKEGRKITKENYLAAKNVGRAYGFFTCSASKEDIEAVLPEARSDSKIPEGLELSLIEGVDNLKGDSDLGQVIKEAKKDSMKYVMTATYPHATNEETSGELQALLINTSNSLFCDTEEHIRGKVVYKNPSGKYIFRK